MTKNILLITLFFTCSILKAQDAFTFTTLVDENYLGAWALKQHNEICSRLYDAVSHGTLQAVDEKKKAIPKEAALKIFEEKISTFIYTNPDDPTEGHDTVYYAPAIKYFLTFGLNGDYIEVHIDSVRKIVFNKDTFYKLLSPDHRMYIEKYMINNLASIEKIEITSHKILTPFSVALYRQCLKPEIEVYRSDSLSKTFTENEKKSLGIMEIIVFIPTDLNDPTIGRDSICQVYSDTPEIAGIFFSMKSGAGNFDLKMSSMAPSHYIHNYYVYPEQYKTSPLGFIRYEKADTIFLKEKAFLDTILRFTIQEKLSEEQLHYKAFRSLFGSNVEIIDEE